MLERILPSARWRLLKALWINGATGSVHAMAKQNEMSYSTAYTELKRLEQASFACSDVVGNALLFRANKDHPAAPSVEALVRASTEDSRSHEQDHFSLQVMANLKSLGAPIRIETKPSADMALEETVAQGLRLTHRHPTLARAFPVLLARNRHELNMEGLKQRAMALNEKQALGFFLELTAELANDARLRSFAQTLKDRRIKRVRNFFEGRHGKYAQALADQRCPQVASDWHFRMDMDMENFQQFYSKHCRE